ncbi:MAG: magnesium transporter CorA [Chitinophagaceae bacterium]|nr:magnesium transporter CorA [Chitinophagaceae bacterium]
MTNLMTKPGNGFEWIDLIAPSNEEIEQIAQKYNLHDASINDSLEADHLPKFERLKNYSFLVLRMYTSVRALEADSMKELTDKLSVFISDSFIITIHKNPWEPLERINERSVKTGDCQHTGHVLNEIVKAVLRSFDEPSGNLTQAIEYYEEQIFLKDKKIPLLKGLYFLKRKVDVIQRILLLSYDIIDSIDPTATSNADTRDIRDLFVKYQSIFDSMAANMNHLLAIYFNTASQKTNETIRVLTIFSVFFMPLTFIVGVYGMNFRVMPELQWRWGYPVVMVSMALVVIAIFVWFRRKKWL